MHPNLDQLLALRDGEGTVGVERHVALCEQCRAEIEDLRATAAAMRDLPTIPPPEGSWEDIRRRLVTHRRRPADWRLGVAAAVLLALASAAVIWRFDSDGGDPPGVEAGEVRDAVEQLESASRELELVLQEASLQSRVLSPRRAAMIVEIEDRIALVDLAISENHEQSPGVHTVALWSDRVELLDALVTARGGAVPVEGVAHASNRPTRRER
jgi:hypothetical protein